MKARAVSFLLAVIAVLLCSCNSADGIQSPEAGSDSGSGYTREQAIEKIEAISPGADISSISDMDKVVDEVRYYFIKARFPSRMTAEYYVDEKQGNIFIAIGGELDTSNPLSKDSISQGAADAEPLTEISAIKTDELKDILEAIGMTAQQVEEKFGSGYSKVSVEYNGHMEGYLYGIEGFTVAFGDDGKVARVYCSDKIEIGGARTGMDFSQIQEKLGNTAFRQTWVETPVNAAYQIEYGFSGRTVVFFSRQSDGSNSIMSIK